MGVVRKEKYPQELGKTGFQNVHRPLICGAVFTPEYSHAQSLSFEGPSQTRSSCRMEGRSVKEQSVCVCVFAKTSVNWNGSSQDHQPRPLYDLQFEDLSILERRTSSDVPSVTGLLSSVI